MVNPRGGNVFVQGLLGQVSIESGFPCQKIVRIEESEHQVSVRHLRVRLYRSRPVRMSPSLCGPM